MNMNTQNNPLAGIPEGSKDFLAQKAQRYIIEQKCMPEYEGMTIRVVKNRGRYYITEWCTGRQSFSGSPQETPVARISPVKGEKVMWQLAWMRRDLKWHNLVGNEYRGAFDQCLKTIVEDPDCAFWG